MALAALVATQRDHIGPRTPSIHHRVIADHSLSHALRASPGPGVTGAKTESHWVGERLDVPGGSITPPSVESTDETEVDGSFDVMLDRSVHPGAVCADSQQVEDEERVTDVAG